MESWETSPPRARFALHIHHGRDARPLRRISRRIRRRTDPSKSRWDIRGYSYPEQSSLREEPRRTQADRVSGPYAGNVLPGNGKQRWSEGRIAELERKVGQQALEIDFLKGCLQRIEEQRMLQALAGSPRSTGRSKKK